MVFAVWFFPHRAAPYTACQSSSRHPRVTQPIRSRPMASPSSRLRNTLSTLGWSTDLIMSSCEIANPYGRYQNPHAAQGAVSVFLERALNRQPIEIWGNGEAVRDYIYISDVIEAMIAAITYSPGPRLFNVGSGHGRSVNEVVQAIRQARWMRCRRSPLARTIGRHSVQRPRYRADLLLYGLVSKSDLRPWHPACAGGVAIHVRRRPACPYRDVGLASAARFWTNCPANQLFVGSLSA